MSKNKTSQKEKAPRRNHVVPQAHLNYFSDEKDKYKLKTFLKKESFFQELGKRSIKSIGFEKDLYVFKKENGEWDIQLEKYFAEKIEPNYNKGFYDIVSKIRLAKNLERVLTKKRKAIFG